jgi:acetyl esterase/lipase
MHPISRICAFCSPPLRWPRSRSPPPRGSAQPPRLKRATPATSTQRHGACDARGAGAADPQHPVAAFSQPRHARPGPAAVARRPAQGHRRLHARARVAWTQVCPNQIVEDKIAGVPVHIVTPDGMPDANKDKVLLNLHGGGFNSDSGSYTESIPIASYTKVKVVAVLYRLAPESSLSRRRRRFGGRLQGAAQDLQAQPHRDLWNLGRSHS